MDRLKVDFSMKYDEKDSIGKRYRRQDAIGTPFCITVDYETLDNDTVTIRRRYSMEQERVSIESLPGLIGGLVSWKHLLHSPPILVSERASFRKRVGQNV